MQKVSKKIGIALFLLALLAIVLWWWYLRPDPMEQPSLSGQLLPGEMRYEGHRRQWLSYVPASKPYAPPLLLVLHGSLGDGVQMREASRYGFDLIADREGIVVVYPDGYEQHWNDCRASADYAANTEQIDDVGFLKALVRRMIDEHGIDPERVYVTGISNGGHMAFRLGMEAPELVAGIAAVAANLPVFKNIDCSLSEQPVATMIMNGTEDPINPYEGGIVTLLGDSSRGEVQSALDSASYWAQRAGYQGAGTLKEVPRRKAYDYTAVERRDWWAPGKAPVSLVTIINGGHTLPHPDLNLPRVLGRTSHQMDGPEVIWQFFSLVEATP